MISGRRRAALAAGAGVVVAVVIVVVVVGATSPSPPPARAPRADGPRRVAPASRPARAPPVTKTFGVNVNLLFNDFSYTPPQIDAQLAGVSATGATVARSDALWDATEPQAPDAGHHRYDWTFDDAIAGHLAAQRLTWLPILDYSAPWAQSIPGQDHSPPRADADYAAYAAAVAGRYGPGGDFWRTHPQLPARPLDAIEIWNEPDSRHFWRPRPDAARYAALYLSARTAIDGVDPGIRVIVGGLTDASVFLPALVAAQPLLRDHVDGVAIHPYGIPSTVVARVRSARAALNSAGMPSVPLYVTEFGWTTSPPGALHYVAASRRPGYIESTLATLRRLSCGIASVMMYTWVSPEHNRADSQDWYGIAGPGGGQTAATAAYAAGIREGALETGEAGACRE